MSTNLDWEKIKFGGFIISQYMFIRMFGVLGASLLGYIISEYKFAIKNKLTVDDCFLTNKTRMADYLGVTEYTLEQTLNELAQYEVIDWYKSNIENTIMIFVNVNVIIELKQDLDEQYNYLDWDTGLKQAQNPTHKKNTFTESTLQIKDFIENNITEYIPMIVYQRCNDFITEYESQGTTFTNDIVNWKDYIIEYLSPQDYGLTLFVLIEYLCHEYWEED